MPKSETIQPVVDIPADDETWLTEVALFRVRRMTA